MRTVWDDQTEEWYFSIVDVVGVLTDSVNPTDYIKKMKKRDPELSKGWGQIVTPLSVQTAGGRQRVNCATTQGMFRIIQSIPSPKAEPFKQWMAQVAADRLDQMQDPELSIQQAMVDYKRLGYSDNWINQRLKAIEVRKDLTDAWKKRGVQEGQHRTHSQHACGGFDKGHNRSNRPPDACSTQSGRATRRHNCPQCPAGTRSKNRPQGGFSVECTSGITNREDGRGGIAGRR